MASIFQVIWVHASIWTMPVLTGRGNMVPWGTSFGRSRIAGQVNLIKLSYILLGCDPFLSYEDARTFSQQVLLTWRSPFCLSGNCILAQQLAHRRDSIRIHEGNLMRILGFDNPSDTWNYMFNNLMWTKDFGLCQGQRKCSNSLQPLAFSLVAWNLDHNLGSFCEGNLTNSRTSMD